ncbi:MAG: protein kinase [Holophagaceae bacterium]|nr:protein kinase [Holophagaceae bacterium]
MRTRIGKFEIQRRLGEGAMGEVFLGRDPIIGREVAIKTIRPQIATGEEARERFYREARAAGTLNHPNLVTVHEFGEDDGTLFLAMEYVPGQDLQTLLLDHSLTRPQILEIVAQICDGLAYAHARGVMHRDIKPSNIRVDWHQGRPFVKVMDFGIARIAGSDMTGSGTILGTFGYMAPEYISSGIPDPRADIFACGVILYEALAGERPFLGDTTATVLYRIVHEQPKPMDPAHLHGISPAVQSILDQALEKDPSLRYQRAEVMSAALRSAKDPHWLGGVAMGTTASMKSSSREAQAAPTVAANSARTATSSPVAAARPATKTPSNAGIWAAGLIVAAGLAAAGAWFWLREPANPPTSLAQANPAGSAMSPAAVPPRTPAPKIEVPKAIPVEPKDRILPRPLPFDAEKAPEPPMSPERPQPVQESGGTAGINEASGDVESHPQRAHQLFQMMQRKDPQNARAYALDLVALYHMGQYGEMAALLHKAKASGVNPRAFNAYPRFRMMMKEEARAHRIPRPLAERMKAAGHDFNSGE